MPTVVTIEGMEANDVSSDSVQHYCHDSVKYQNSSLKFSHYTKVLSKPHTAKVESLPSVKVEVVPDLDLLLENNEDLNIQPGMLSALERNKKADQNVLAFNSCPTNLNRVTLIKTGTANQTHNGSDICQSQHKSFDCLARENTFDNVGDLGFQLESHSDTKEYNSHERTGKFKCGGHNGNSCPRVYVLKSSLRKHMRKYANVRSKMCDVCGKEFEFISTLTRHVVLVHSKAGDHKCGLCNKEFLHKTSLDRHKLTHGKVRDHKCEVCGKDFAYKDALTLHVRTHSESRDHKCGICGKEFLKRANMNRHVLTHSKVRDKKCGVCGDTFAHKSTLNSHMLTHNSETNCNRI